MACMCDYPILAETILRGWSGEMSVGGFCANCGEAFSGPPVAPVSVPRRKYPKRPKVLERGAAQSAAATRKWRRWLSNWSRKDTAPPRGVLGLLPGTRIQITDAIRTSFVAGLAGTPTELAKNHRKTYRALLEPGRVYVVTPLAGHNRDGDASYQPRRGAKPIAFTEPWQAFAGIRLVAEGGDATQGYFALPGEFTYIELPQDSGDS